MKSNKSITKKLFIVTTVVFTVFLSLTLIVQSVFFESFYISKKKNMLTNEIEKFISVYDKNNDTQSIINNINQFEEKTSSKIAIMDNNGRLKIVTKSNNQRIESDKFNMINNAIGEVIRNGISIDEIKSSSKPKIYVSRENSVMNMRNIITAIYNESSDEIIFSVASLQPINEATLAMKEFYMYFYVGAIALTLILSLVFSRKISKPLIKINDTAMKMANLDFSEKCEVKSDDEIGNLANTLNFLSENLNEALTCLRSANLKLEEDINKERNLEKMRKNFVAAVSHELKTPISLIEGYAEGIKDNIFEGEDKEYYLDVILDESKKMGDLVKDMLDLSQLESGNFKLIKENFNLSELIETVLRKFSIPLNEKKIVLNKSLVTECNINADWTKIEQVMTNFITNAIRHTDEHGKIDVILFKNEDKFRIEVYNQGNSIPSDELEKIWDNFYKIDKSRNRQLGGTGIGLAIVKNIVTLHAGSCGVYNTEQGVKFYFEI